MLFFTLAITPAFSASNCCFVIFSTSPRIIDSTCSEFLSRSRSCSVSLPVLLCIYVCIFSDSSRLRLSSIRCFSSAVSSCVTPVCASASRSASSTASPIYFFCSSVRPSSCEMPRSASNTAIISRSSSSPTAVIFTSPSDRISYIFSPFNCSETAF